jgi:hypothetical protein
VGDRTNKQLGFTLKIANKKKPNYRFAKNLGAPYSQQSFLNFFSVLLPISEICAHTHSPCIPLLTLPPSYSWRCHPCPRSRLFLTCARRRPLAMSELRRYRTPPCVPPREPCELYVWPREPPHGHTTTASHREEEDDVTFRPQMLNLVRLDIESYLHKC